jgi:hypothetical protein
MQTTALSTLSHKLIARAAPPSLIDLWNRLAASESYAEFMGIVHEFTPEIESDVRRAAGPGAKMALFATTFEQRYFPLWPHFSDGMAQEYDELCSFIHVIVTSIDYEDYETLCQEQYWRHGLMLAAYILADPYHPEPGCHSAMYVEESGARIPLGEACAAFVSQEVLARVPKDGLPVEDAHRLLDGTKFEALATVGDILNFQTGDPFHDNDEESAAQGGEDLEWTRENVEALTQGWLRAQLTEQKAERLYDWLEEDPARHLAELLDFIEARREELSTLPEKPVQIPKYKPSDSDRRWLKDLVHNLRIGGTWVAPMGFTFEKVGEKRIKLINASLDPRLHADAIEMIYRTVAVGKDAHIRVDIDDLDKMLKGGDHDANARTAATPVAIAAGAGSGAGPAEDQARLL